AGKRARAVPGGEFLRELYWYFSEKGFVNILLTFLVHLLSLGAIIVFLAWAFLFVRWDRLMKCTDGAPEFCG
ncbi:unnamed protein product, partial [Symbiodinium sp. KB8]